MNIHSPYMPAFAFDPAQSTPLAHSTHSPREEWRKYICAAAASPRSGHHPSGLFAFAFQKRAEMEFYAKKKLERLSSLVKLFMLMFVASPRIMRFNFLRFGWESFFMLSIRWMKASKHIYCNYSRRSDLCDSGMDIQMIVARVSSNNFLCHFWCGEGEWRMALVCLNPQAVSKQARRRAKKMRFHYGYEQGKGKYINFTLIIVEFKFISSDH
jgi:hypothetical protein